MVAYWDTSAVVPLLVREADTPLREKQFGALKGMVTWWATRLECLSALSRRQLEGVLTPDAVETARRRLTVLFEQWQEVLPSDVVRSRAERLLRIHPLRAADALQLAAALLAANERPEGTGFYCADGRLNDAAAKEGFQVFPGIPAT